MVQFRVLQEPALRRLLISQGLSDAADWLDFVAIFVIAAFSFQAGPLGLSTVALATALPRLVCTPIAGILADSSPVIRLIVLSHAARAICLIAMTQVSSFWGFILLVGFEGAASAFYYPSKQVLIRSSAPREALMRVNAISQAVTQTSKIVWPAVGGLLISFASAYALLVGAAVLLALAAGILQCVRPHRHSLQKSNDKGEALPYLKLFSKAPQPLRIGYMILAAAIFPIFLFDLFIPILVNERQLGESFVGYIISSIAVGGVLGAFVLGNVEVARRQPLVIMLAGIATIATGILLIGLLVSKNFFLLFGPWCLAGIGSSMLFVSLNTLIQQSAPEGTVGRYSSLANAISDTARLASPPIGGFLIHRAGLDAVLMIVGTAMLIGSGMLVIAVVMSGVLRLDVSVPRSGKAPED